MAKTTFKDLKNKDEYLIAVGWENDDNAMKKVLDTVSSSIKKLDEYLSGNGKAWVTAAKRMGLAYMAMNNYAVKMAREVAELDKLNQMLGKQYMVSSDAWMAYSNALQELGMNYEDLFYATDEIKDQFNDLIVLGRQLEPPAGIQETTKLIRELEHEQRRYHTIIAYGKQWILYYLGQELNPTLQNIRDTVHNLLDTIARNIQPIAQSIAKVMALTLRMFYPIFAIVSRIAQGLANLQDEGVDLVRVITIISVVLSFLLGPLGKVHLIFAALSLLIKDFLAWKNGEKSLAYWQGFSDLIEGVNQILGKVFGWIAKLFGMEETDSALMVALGALASLLTLIADAASIAFNSVAALFNLITGDIQGAKEAAERVISSGSEMFGITAANKASEYLADKSRAQSAYYTTNTSTTNRSTTNTKNYTDNSTVIVQSMDDAITLQQKKIQALNNEQFRSNFN